MRPHTPPILWEEFCRVTGPYAIAIDGSVSAGPRFDPSGPRLNLNHHEEVDRLATRATCGQALVAIRQGLFELFRDVEGPRADVYANDCDEDVCMTWYLLKNPHLSEHALNPILNRLVWTVDILDTTAGTYPFPADIDLLQELAWIFEPYRRFRISGGLGKKDPDAYASVVTDVTHRIEKYVAGRGKTLPLDTRYTRIGGGTRWALIEEVGREARTGAFADGIRAFVSVRPRSANRYDYTIGRMSLFIPFDIPAIIARLNEIERTTNDRWGGGDTIGGSPRVGGSAITPAELERIINEIMARSA